MKRNAITTITAAFALMLCLAFTSCESDIHHRYYDSDFYGKWYSTSYDGYYLTTITFYSDGFGIIEDWEGDFIVSSDRFEWEPGSRYLHIYYYDYGTEDHWAYRFVDYGRLYINFGGGNYAYFDQVWNRSAKQKEN